MKNIISGITLSVILSGCATVISGVDQDVTFNSVPGDATVIINSIPRGTTPLTVSLKRRGHYEVTLEKEGYYPTNFVMRRKVNPAIIGNILVGGVIGVGVDAATGAMWDLSTQTYKTEVMIPFKYE